MPYHKLKRPATIDEARNMARIRIADAAPLWGLSRASLSLKCLRGEIPGAVKLGGNWFITPEGMDQYFASGEKKKRIRRLFW